MAKGRETHNIQKHTYGSARKAKQAKTIIIEAIKPRSTTLATWDGEHTRKKKNLWVCLKKKIINIEEAESTGVLSTGYYRN